VRAAKSQRIALRSPHSMLRYLGQYIAAEAGMRKSAANFLGGDLIVVDQNRKELAPSDIAVDYCGTVYSIPCDSCGSSTSMKCLSILSQLIALQKTSDELPKTPVTNLLNN
jgi:hypothetical protein